MIKYLISTHYICLAILGLSNATAQDLQFVGKKNCQFQQPSQWVKKQLVWEGSCNKGKADGEGVLKAYTPNQPTEIFYGQIQAGVLQQGILELAEGYQAGHFVNGVFQTTQDRNSMIKHFDLASKIANSYAQRLQQSGNNQSAVFYHKKASDLAQQMD